MFYAWDMSERVLRQTALIGILISFAGVAAAQPAVVPGGVLNAASFAKNASGQGTPVAPGSLVSIFGTSLGSSQADASTVPFSTALGGVSVKFNGIDAPMRDVVPAAQLLNVQIPFNVLPAGQTSGTVNVVVTVFGTQTAPQPVQIVPQAPGIFTIPPGVGNAVLVNLSAAPDPTSGLIAAPAGSIQGLTTGPIARGSFAFMYATGLGIMTPPVANGDADGARHDALTLPKLTIGGVDATVLFAGQAPGFPGVYQVNLQIPNNAPTGDKVVIRMASSDGTQQSPDLVATIAIR
jgi:minor extracellular serine protease Vpr